MTDTSSSSPNVVPRVAAAVAALTVHFLTLMLAIVVLCSVVPEYIRFFDDADIELPAMTQLLIHWSWFCAKYWYLVVFLGMVADAIIVAVLTLAASKRQWLLSVYSHLWLLAVILFLFLISIALCIPIYALNEPGQTVGATRTVVPIHNPIRS